MIETGNHAGASASRSPVQRGTLHAEEPRGYVQAGRSSRAKRLRLRLHASSEAHPGRLTGGPLANTEDNVPRISMSLTTRGHAVTSWDA